MEFAFSEDQFAFRDAVRDLLAKECPPEVVRSAWPDGPDDRGARPGEGRRADPAAVDRVWQALAEMGVLGIAVPEEQGGLGLSEVDWVLLAEETGYAALPAPFVETVCVGAPWIADGPDDDLAMALPGIVNGLMTVAVAVFPTSTRDGSPATINLPWGEPDRLAFVIWASDAALADPKLAAAVNDGFHVSVVRRSELAAGGSVDSVQPDVASVDLGRHVRHIDTVLHPATADSFSFQSDPVADGASAFDRGALGTAAQLLGLGRRMLDMTVAYACERKQFGVPIGSQQAVKHHLADAALQLQFAAPAVYRAAWSMSTGAETASRDVSMAKAMASDAARLVGRKALQVHGAIGYTVEYDLHLYFKRAEALARAWGDAAWHRRRVADALGI